MDWIKIFENETAARQRLVPDKPQLVIINDKRISLILHKDQFYAVQDSCPHNGESLSKGYINYLGEIICPWHNYQFDLQTGRECRVRSVDLRTYPVRSDETGFFIGL